MMNGFPRNRSILIAAWTLAFATPVVAGELALPGEIRAIMNAPRYAHASWGLAIADVSSGTLQLAHEPDRLLAPASTTKLFTCAAALEIMGADHQFVTKVYRRGRLANGVVEGDLILLAAGDPNLGGRAGPSGRIAYRAIDHTYADANTPAELVDGDPLTGLRELARQVALAGIRRVSGDVLIDDGLFDRAESTGSGPVRLTPIVINDNLIDILVTPTQPGTPARLEVRPASKYLSVANGVETVPAGLGTNITVEPTGGPFRFLVRGRIAAGSKPALRVQEVGDPRAFARLYFIEAMERAGIALATSPFSSSGRLPSGSGEYAGMEKVAEFRSFPLASEIELILKVSHNQHASLLPIWMGLCFGKRTLADGLCCERDALERLGVPVGTISFGGGAGGSRADLVTPRATVALLVGMNRRRDAAVFRAALPILGMDGTLARAVEPSSPARGKVRAKTGTYLVTDALNDRLILTSKALAGYIEVCPGKDLAFSLLVNHVPLERIEDKDEVGKDLARISERLYLLFSQGTTTGPAK